MTIAEAVKASKTFAAMSKGSIKAAEAMLMPKEDVLFACVTEVVAAPALGRPSKLGTIPKEKLYGVLAITTDRVFFAQRVLGKGTSSQISIEGIRSIEDETDPFSGILRIVGDAEYFDILCMRLSLLSDMKNAIAEALDRKRTASAAAPAGSGTVSAADQLRELKKLYDEGILTAEEFAAKKSQILGI